MRAISLIVAIWLLCPFVVFAEIIEEGRGLLFGPNHAFFVTAGPGWVLDNKSGANRGLHMVFYPSGESWSDSPVIVYGRSVPKSIAPTVKIQVEKTVKAFHQNGNPKYAGKKQPSLELSNGQPVEIFHFSGDKWGNYEAAGYFVEKDTINFLIYSARTKETFIKHLKDFYEIAHTYVNIYTSASVPLKLDFDSFLLNIDMKLTD